MARMLLKERQFEPTGVNLGDFESKDLVTFDLQFKDDDIEKTDDEGDDKKSKKPKVPNPIDNNPLEKEDKSKKVGGASDDTQPKNPNQPDVPQDEKEDQGLPDVPDDWDPAGQDLDDYDPDMPDSDGSQSSMGNDSGDESEGEDDIPNFSSGNNDDSLGQSSGDSDSTEDGQDAEGDEGDGNPSNSQDGSGDNSSSDSNNNENPGNSEGEEGQSGESSGQGAQNGQSGQGGDQQDGEQGDDPGDFMDDEFDDENSDVDSQSNTNNTQQSQSSQDSTGRGGKGNGSGGQKYDLDKLFGEDDDFDPFGGGDSDDSSDLEKAIQEIEKNESTTAKERRKAEESMSKADEDNRNQRNRDAEEEAEAAKDIISTAIRDSDNSQPDDTTDGDPRNSRDRDEEDEVFASLGAGCLTTMFNPNNAKDWRSQLDRLFDKALGYDIVTNPNLFNKKIEDAPPGREDFNPEIKNVAILLDWSGSMDAYKFKEVIYHIDTMLKARKLTRARFHIFAWGSSSLDEISKYYVRCKGANFKKTIMTKFAEEGPWGTTLTPVPKLVMQKVKRPDAIIIMTDAEINGSDSFNRDPYCQKFIKKFKNKIIWALTSNAQYSNVAKFDPTAVTKKRCIKFKKGGRG